MTKEKAMEELHRCSDTQFDRNVVVALEQFLNKEQEFLFGHDYIG